MSNPEFVFDPSLYVRAPVFTLGEGVVLARSLLAACPKALLPTIKKPLDRLKARADEAEAALVARQRQSTLSEEDTRLLDTEMDNCLNGIDLRLSGYMALSATSCPKSVRARELRQKLFGDAGLGFLRDTYASQLSAMRVILQRIDQEKLPREIDDLCGPEFLEQFRKLLPRYESMVHGVLTRETTVSENLHNHRLGLQRAVTAYANAVCGTVDDTDASSITLAVTALAPLDNLRNNIQSRRSTAEPTPT